MDISYSFDILNSVVILDRIHAALSFRFPDVFHIDENAVNAVSLRDKSYIRAVRYIH